MENIKIKYSDSTQLHNDLKEKIKLKTELMNLLEINFKKLKNLCTQLITVASPDQAQVMAKEVSHIRIFSGRLLLKTRKIHNNFI